MFHVDPQYKVSSKSIHNFGDEACWMAQRKSSDEALRSAFNSMKLVQRARRNMGILWTLRHINSRSTQQSWYERIIRITATIVSVAWISLVRYAFLVDREMQVRTKNCNACGFNSVQVCRPNFLSVCTLVLPKSTWSGTVELYTLAFSQFEENEEGHACNTLWQIMIRWYKNLHDTHKYLTVW